MTPFLLLIAISWAATLISVTWTAICQRLDCYNGGAIIVSGVAIGTAVAAGVVKWWPA